MKKKLAKAYDKIIFSYISTPECNVCDPWAQHTDFGLFSKVKISNAK